MVMCGSIFWCTDPPPGPHPGTSPSFFARPGISQKKLARVRKFHSIFLPRARNYHWLKLPGSGNITSFLKFTPGSPGGGSVYQKVESHIIQGSQIVQVRIRGREIFQLLYHNNAKDSATQKPLLSVFSFS